MLGVRCFEDCVVETLRVVVCVEAPIVCLNTPCALRKHVIGSGRTAVKSPDG